MIIRRLEENEYEIFKREIQEAFQKGFEDYFGKTDMVIIPDEDIDESYTCEGSNSFVAVEDGEIIGGCVVQINEKTQINDLHLLYVKVGVQSKGVGFAIWKEMERLFPNTVVWKTCTPYFDQRNIHFYINKCGFHAVEFINKYHHNNIPDDFESDGGEGMFEFEKRMNGATK